MTDYAFETKHKYTEQRSAPPDGHDQIAALRMTTISSTIDQRRVDKATLPRDLLHDVVNGPGVTWDTHGAEVRSVDTR